MMRFQAPFKQRARCRKEQCFSFFCRCSKYEDEGEAPLGEKEACFLEQSYFHFALSLNFMHNQDITLPLNWLADYQDRTLGSRPFSQVGPGNDVHADCRTAAGIDSTRTGFVAFKKY